MKNLSLLRMVCIVFVFCAATAIASPAQVLTTLHSFAGPPNEELSLAPDWCKPATGTSTGQPSGAGPAATVRILMPAAVARFSKSPQTERCTRCTASTARTALRLLPGWSSHGRQLLRDDQQGRSQRQLFVSFCQRLWHGLQNHPQRRTDHAAQLRLSLTVRLPTTGWCRPATETFTDSPEAGLQRWNGVQNHTSGYADHAVQLWLQPTTAHPFGRAGTGQRRKLLRDPPAGGANEGGAVFKITSTGTLTTLYSFCSQPNCADGAGPYGGLVQARTGISTEQRPMAGPAAAAML